jgi:hypothetical protein
MRLYKQFNMAAKVEWMKYSALLSHLQDNCSACPDCRHYCDVCKTFVKNKETDHQNSELHLGNLEQLRIVDATLDEGRVNVQSNSANISPHLVRLGRGRFLFQNNLARQTNLTFI